MRSIDPNPEVLDSMTRPTVAVQLDDGMAQEFDVLIERDEEAYLVASVPALPECHTQARSLDELMERVKEAITACLEVDGRAPASPAFVGVHRIRVG